MKVLLLLFLSFKAYSIEFQIFLNEQPPYVVNYKGNASGIAVDIVKELFKKSNLEYKFTFYPLVRSLRDTKITPNTCAMPIGRSQDREYDYRWVNPLVITQLAVFSKKGNPVKINVIEDLVKHEIGAVRGSDESEYLKGIGVNVDDVASNKGNVKKLSSDRIELWAADSIVASYYAKKEGFDLEEKLIFKTTLKGLACNLDISERDYQVLRKTLHEMYQDGSIQKIYEKYIEQLSQVSNAF